ncbi:hypothetical protein BU25DRAFT_482271 [Macroventuria anomochaeta]|uniref:Uncharacterized protein n=1 Tax=Macroventuria anomochaeta TaxID=301207 RepID=A0ACB6RLE7_9PLEO|nr:uncharacterized protein BU25DRAFT_482271 [Macroventuria anomochaeta]KAF2621789.1 hypothetical protein BU25DRAFT_482271 [Macroventuria anomochaeta]
MASFTLPSYFMPIYPNYYFGHRTEHHVQLAPEHLQQMYLQARFEIEQSKFSLMIDSIFEEYYGHGNYNIDNYYIVSQQQAPWAPQPSKITTLYSPITIADTSYADAPLHFGGYNAPFTPMHLMHQVQLQVPQNGPVPTPDPFPSRANANQSSSCNSPAEIIDLTEDNLIEASSSASALANEVIAVQSAASEDPRLLFPRSLPK